MALSKPQRDRLAQGWALHQQGKLLEAEKIYEGVRKQVPRDAEVLHLLGTVALRTDRAALAVELIVAALRIDPTLANAHNNLGNALRELERPADAIASYDKALALQPGLSEALNNRGNARLDLRQHAAALADYDAAIARQPAYADAHSNRAMALDLLDRPQDALAACDRAIGLQPSHANVHARRGALLLRLGRTAEAVASLRRAASLNPELTVAQLDLGRAYLALQRYEDALVSLDRAIALDPGLTAAHRERGRATTALHRFEDGVSSVARLIVLRPDDAEVLDLLGVALARARRHAESLAAFKRAVALAPAHASIICNLGIAWRNLGDWDAAQKCFDRALALDPTQVNALINQGLILWEHERRIDALTTFNRAMQLAPDNAEVGWNAGFLLLQMGDFTRGWPLYENRKRIPALAQPRTYLQMEWTGAEPVSGKIVFVHWEQGLGDTLQFARFLPHLTKLGATVIFSAQNNVHEVLTNLGPAITVIDEAARPAVFDLHCSLMSLPGALSLTEADLGMSAPYLGSDAAHRAKWAGILPARTRPRVGLVWSGNTTHTNDRRRSIPLETIAPRLPGGVEWIALQKDIRPEDARTMDRCGAILQFSDRLDDFADTAALIDTLDLVVSVDTSVAHLAAAMGKPTWVMLPKNPDWRWLLDRTDSPWYPSMTLFRQPHPDVWDGVITALAEQLTRFFDGSAKPDPVWR